MRSVVSGVAVVTLGIMASSPLRAQDLRDTLGRVLQGFQGQQQPQNYDPRNDPRYDPRYGGAPQRHEGDRRDVYSDRMGVQDRIRALDEADRRLDAQQRQLDEDRRRIEAERRRLPR